MAKHNPQAPTLETREKVFDHESFLSRSLTFHAHFLKSPEFILLSATYFYEDRNHLLTLDFKLFKRTVVDAFVFHKYLQIA